MEEEHATYPYIVNSRTGFLSLKDTKDEKF